MAAATVLLLVGRRRARRARRLRAVRRARPPATAPTSTACATRCPGCTGYDLVLVDCPPSLGGLTRTGLTACDRAIVVTEPGLFAVMAVGRAMRTIDELRRGPAPALQPLGIVVNRVRARSIEQAFRLEELQTLYGPLVLTPPVPERAALQQAQGAAQPVHAWPGAAAAELARTFDELLDRALRAPRPTSARRERPPAGRPLCVNVDAWRQPAVRA